MPSRRVLNYHAIKQQRQIVHKVSIRDRETDRADTDSYNRQEEMLTERLPS